MMPNGNRPCGEAATLQNAFGNRKCLAVRSIATACGLRQISGIVVAFLPSMPTRVVLPKLLAVPVLFAGMLYSAGSPIAAEDSVRITVSGGRSFEGQVDAATDDEHLVLRSGSDRAWIGRTIVWSRVVDGEYDGEAVGVEALKAIADRIKTPSPVPQPLPDNLNQATQNAVQANGATDYALLLPPSVSAIAFDAVLANWDGDVEADGLIVYLQPIDRWGSYMAATGSVEIELYAPQRRAFHHAPRSGGTSHELISRWTCAVGPGDFGPRGAMLKFPFGAAHPEFDGDLGAHGLVHVRMTVPGSGVFEDSQDGVRIRPFAPLRDGLQLNTGRRFLPNELTGRGKTAFDGRD
jgi:hypothetical protein